MGKGKGGKGKGKAEPIEEPEVEAAGDEDEEMEEDECVVQQYITRNITLMLGSDMPSNTSYPIDSNLM